MTTTARMMKNECLCSRSLTGGFLSIQLTMTLLWAGEMNAVVDPFNLNATQLELNFVYLLIRLTVMHADCTSLPIHKLVMLVPQPSCVFVTQAV